ncbi:hypothetical protein SLS56_004358 [Neofusicoccum ribis]|uniref:Short-chain dehydrogenase n=1 Tax=Neofusicoccum ribis TaxID=45134 RepID=A0ABR3SWK4_9PEZI
MAGTFIITGAAGGLGLALAENIINRSEGFNCIFTVRNKAASNAKPLHALVDATKKEAEIRELDLSTLDAIRTFAEHINQKVASRQLPPIRALILNAAVVPINNQRLYTTIGNNENKLEMSFAVNHLANFLLAMLLLESMDRETGRIVLVSSHAHDPKGADMRKYDSEKLAWDLEEISQGKELPEPGDEGNDVMRRYGMSKLCQIIFMHALQRRLNTTPGLDKICVLAVNPGAMVHSNILTKMNPFMRYVAGPMALGVFTVMSYVKPDGIMRTVAKSAADVERAALAVNDPKLGKYPKDIYLDGARLVKPAEDSFNKERQRELWDVSFKLAGLKESDTALS